MRRCSADVQRQLSEAAAATAPKKGTGARSAVFVAVDGNKVPKGLDAEDHVTAEALVKGDGRVYSIAAASILAKVTRDRIMLRHAQTWPQYGFKVRLTFLFGRVGTCLTRPASYLGGLVATGAQGVRRGSTRGCHLQAWPLPDPPQVFQSCPVNARGTSVAFWES